LKWFALNKHSSLLGHLVCKMFGNIDASSQSYKSISSSPMKHLNQLERLSLLSFSCLVLCLPVMLEPTLVQYGEGTHLKGLALLAILDRSAKGCLEQTL